MELFQHGLDHLLVQRVVVEVVVNMEVGVVDSRAGQQALLLSI